MMRLGTFLAAGILVAAPAFAQDQCQDADVYQYGPKLVELRRAWQAEITKGTRRADGGYNFSPEATSLERQISAQDSLIQRCAEMGNMHARYLYALHLEEMGDGLTITYKYAQQFAPVQAAQAQTLANQNYSEANKWFALAANQGHAPAMMHIGDNYAEGKGFNATKFLGIEWFSKAANRAIETGNRDLAVLCLERMTALDSSHPMTKALMKTLYGGARE